ncbi:dihydrolipoyllysine-residue acetyltransferase component of acetoin cleaving system-like [Panicum miliaceum]|uniref:Dihydrolipoyllysine-residue acetyltransferase component of acetoin cleaving system-like n=1 Tax=Panicum miliaceum TaxID=4540 RepID=A0A3L6QYU0_PANMI|nr:dihydrolipoyllysine-residue acetyltransferase component of acetoin cleaving system-like [Panicum miliaceum]
MGFGVVSLLNAVFRRMFTSAGLRPASATVDAEDTTIHFWAHPSLLQPSSSSEQQPPRPVVVLIHGFGPDPTWQWAAQAGPLSRHFDLVVPTLLFFGASATRAPARSDAFQAAALAALLTGGGGASSNLPGLGAGRTVHVVGTSYGGLVAYHLARELHRRGGGVRVGKVALCDSDACKGAEDDRALAARSGVAEVAELLAPADTRALRRLMAVCAHRPVKYIPECLLRDMLRKYFGDKREDKIALIKGITTGEGFQLAPLPQEVLIIWGEFDQIFPVEKAHKMKEKLGEKATVRVIPNTGHLPQQEDPKLFNQTLLDFLLHPSASNGSAAAK